MGLLHRIRRARLASQVIRRLRRAGVTDARYQSAAFVVRFTRPGASEPSVLPLAELLAHRPVKKRVRHFVAGFLDDPGMPEKWSEASPMLRPLLRPSHPRGGVPASGPDAPLRRSCLPFLSEFVVVDLPETRTYVAADRIAEWGVDAGEVLRTARANLSGAVLQGVAASPVVVQFTEDESAYWTSHLLLDGWLARLEPQTGGVPVAFAPDHGTLIVTAQDSAHLPELFARSELIYLTSPRAITPMAYVSGDDGRTVPWSPAPGHPIYDCVRRAEAVQKVQEYTRQAETLPDAAPLSLTDGLRTRTVERPGALLPLADEIEIDGEVRPWADVSPGLRMADGIDPPRFIRA